MKMSRAHRVDMVGTYLDDNSHSVGDLILERETIGKEQRDESKRSFESSVEQPEDVERRIGVVALPLGCECCLWMSHLESLLPIGRCAMVVARGTRKAERYEWDGKGHTRR